MKILLVVIVVEVLKINVATILLVIPKNELTNKSEVTLPCLSLLLAANSRVNSTRNYMLHLCKSLVLTIAYTLDPAAD